MKAIIIRNSLPYHLYKK